METLRENIRCYLGPIDSDEFIKNESLAEKLEIMREQLNWDFLGEVYPDEFKPEKYQ
jgi:hypothetical protein